MGGEKTLYSGMQRVVLGSPPHGRGKEGPLWGASIPVRITPARAGKRSGKSASDNVPRDHPRVGGEKPEKRYGGSRQWGSPPRRRGKGDFHIVTHTKVGITPAWAGKSVLFHLCRRVVRDHPRTGGEKMHLSLTLAHDTLHALTQFFNRVAFVDKLQNRSE